MGVAHRWLLAAALLGTPLPAGCGHHHRASTAARPGRVASGPAASCDRPSPIVLADGDLELRGRGRGADLRGLIFATRPLPLRADPQPLKIVWRMTGRGPLRARVFTAGGRELALAWGPEPHGGSNYRRPGDEWGVGYRLRRPGCYRLTFARTTGRAEAWLRVT